MATSNIAISQVLQRYSIIRSFLPIFELPKMSCNYVNLALIKFILV